MRMFRYSPSILLSAAFLVLAPVARAQIGVSNLVDKSSSYNDRVTFHITNSPGFAYLALLNGAPVPIGSAVLVDKPDYYELAMWRTNTSTSAVATQLVRFVVKASVRVDTETGLPPHTPFPVVQSSPSEFVGGNVRLMVPRYFPAGSEIPVVAWVFGSDAHAIRANGLLSAAGHPSVQVKRGVGSGFLSSNTVAGTLNYTPSIAGLATNKTIDIDAATTWTPVSGTLSGATVWPPNSRIHVTGGTIIPAGSSLTVGAGTIVRVNTGVTITNSGTITINGTVDEPVVFMPTVKSQPWGGFVQHANNTTFTATGAIFTGSGLDPCWYNGHGCSSGTSGLGSHRGEQALLALNGLNCNVNLTDSAAIHLAGQLGHSVGGTKSYDLRFTRFLMQGATSGGEYTSVNFTVNDSAFIECPGDSFEHFEDEDNDALYIVSGSGNFTNMLVGWTGDDGIDSGGGGSAPLNYQSCWFEATFHEGNSLSGLKNTFARDTVYIDCGQGIEDGYDAPTGRVDRCLFTACKVGVRFGDNYTGGYVYNGQITATNCISIYNHRDIFGFNWAANGWTNSNRLMASNNLVTTPNAYYPDNALWNPATDAWRLGAYGAPGRVGVGFASRGESVAQLAVSGIPVGLSRFCSNEVTVDYEIDGTDSTHLTGSLVFPQGQTRQYIPAVLNTNQVYRIALKNPANADITRSRVYFAPALAASSNAVSTALVASNSVWRFHDKGTDLGTAWRASQYNDSGWSNGIAQLGVGDNDEGTPVSLTNSAGITNITTYFRGTFTIAGIENYASLTLRLLRDDGGVVFINGNEVFRSSSIPPAPATITYGTLANYNLGSAPGDNAIDTMTLPASVLTNGPNTIAVEIHQFNNTSSDLSFAVWIVGNPAPSRPRMGFTRLGGDMVLLSTDPTVVIEEAADVTGPWAPLPDPGVPVGVTETNLQRFYRLRR